MDNLNSILIEGDLVKDPSIAQTPKGTPVCTFCLASRRFFKLGREPQKEVSVFQVEVWAKLAETCSENLKKGCAVRVLGRLRQCSWFDAEGKNHSRVKIIGEHVELNPLVCRRGKQAMIAAEKEPQKEKR
ncbi:MAG: single-stranded DNA-binding protein [Spirochaetia bacterium]|jgi:single-strand DNA-binding protein|nr:single-stranded DNA-binding protein [Spirochaetia bacterium]